MCSVSYISEPYAKLWEPYTVPPNSTGWRLFPTAQEFDALKAEVAALKDLLLAAKRFDERTGQKDCQHEDKVAVLRRVAELVGVDLSEAIGP